MNTETVEPKSSVNEAKSEAGLAASGGSEVPTPRTDEEVRLCRVKSSSFGDMVGADFAQSLEREIIVAAPYIEIGKRWRENSCLEEWFPFSAQKLKSLEAEVGNAAAIIVKQNQELERLRAPAGLPNVPVSDGGGL